MLKCNVCKKEKELFDFHKMKNGKNGYRSQCKECRKVLTKEYREKNKIRLIEKAIIYQKENKETITIAKKKWVNKNRNLFNEKARVYKKKYYDDNLEDMQLKQRTYRELNSDKIKQWNKEYYQKVKHIKAWRSMLHNTLKRLGQKKEGHTIDLLGYSALTLREYIQSLFTDGMSWDNYGEWHIDHIKSVISFNPDTPLNIVNALRNLQPLWATTREINGIIYKGNLNKGVN